MRFTFVLSRWYRRCAIATTGPWQELGHTKLLDVSLEPVRDDPDTPISVWALASGGQAMFRVGTSRSNPLVSILWYTFVISHIENAIP